MRHRPRTLILALAFAAGSARAAPAEPAVEVLLAQAEEALWESPARAMELDQAIRARAGGSGAQGLVVRAWLNDCHANLEENAAAARSAARSGIALLAPAVHDTEPGLRLELCELQAGEYLGEVSDVLAQYDALLARARALRAPLLVAWVQVVRGEARGFMGRHADGLADIVEARGVIDRDGTPAQRLYRAQAEGILRYRTGDLDQALVLLDGAIEGARARGYTYLMADAIYNRGRALAAGGNSDQAVRAVEQAMALYEGLGRVTSVAYARQLLGEILLQQGLAQKALERIEPALAYFRAARDEDMVARLQQLRGRALHVLRNEAQARAAAEESVRLYRGMANYPAMETAYGLLADTTLALGDLRASNSALLGQREAHSRADVARREELLAQQRVRFDMERNEQQARNLRERQSLAERALRTALEVDRWKTAVIGLGTLILLAAIVLLVRQRRLARRMRDLAMLDELTGIANRRNVLAFLDEQIRLHRAIGRRLCVLLIDIDHFKQFNDRHGHDAGDQVLRGVAAQCQHSLRLHDRVGRTGGEEFLAVLPGVGLERGIEAAERLRASIHAVTFDDVEPGLRTSVSVGVSEWSPDDADDRAVVKRADDALYDAKEGGRDRVMARSAGGGARMAALRTRPGLAA